MITILNEKFKRYSEVSLLIKGGDIRFIDRSGKADDYQTRGEPWTKIKPRKHPDNPALMRETAKTNYAYIFIGGLSGYWIGA